MLGKNKLIISQEEMTRAMEMYFRELVSSPMQRLRSKVVRVRQKGARLENDFIIDIEAPEEKSQQD